MIIIFYLLINYFYTNLTPWIYHFEFKWSPFFSVVTTEPLSNKREKKTLQAEARLGAIIWSKKEIRKRNLQNQASPQIINEEKIQLRSSQYHSLANISSLYIPHTDNNNINSFRGQFVIYRSNDSNLTSPSKF